MKKVLLSLLLAFVALSSQAQYPLLDIRDVQFIDDVDLASGNDLSYIDGDTVTVEGVVVFDPCNYALSSSGSRMGTYISESMTEPWGGVLVLIDPGAIGYSGTLEDLNNDVLFVDNFVPGNRVRFNGIVGDFSGETQIYAIPDPSSIVGFETVPSPVILEVDTFMQNDGSGTMIEQFLTGERWEGSYVEIQNVFAINITPSGDRYFWDISNGAGDFISIRDVSGHFRNGTNDDECPDWLSGTPGVSNTPVAFVPPTEGANLSYVRGVITQGFGEYFIAPLSPSDIGPVSTAPPLISDITRDPVVPTSTDNVTVSATILDTDGTISSAELNYSYGAGVTTFTTVAMTSGGGDLWTASIPGPGVDEEVVNYWIRAEDNAGNVSNSPDTLATGSFYIVYDDGINSIIRIQKNEEGFSSLWAGDSIPSMNVPGIVTSGTQTYDLGMITLQEGTDPWSGIFIRNSDDLDKLYRGDRIEVTSGKVVEEFGVTYLEEIQYNLISSSNAIPGPITGLEPDTLGAGVFLKTEPYEGMLLRFDNAIITSNNPDSGPFGEWMFNVGISTSESGLRVDDFSTDVPTNFGEDSVTLGSTIPYVQGPLWFSFGNYKLIPRNLADIGGFSTSYPNAIVSFRFDDLIPSVNASIDQGAGTITATVPSGTDVTTLSPTVEFTGQFLSPETGTAQDFSAPLTYTVTAPIDGSTRDYVVTIEVEPNGIDDLDGLVSIQAYPNPATDVLNLDLERNISSALQIRIVDMQGKLMQTSQIQGFAGKQRISLDMSAFEQGNYLIEISSEQGSVQRQVSVIRQ
jgi:hypothetical protein